MSLHETNASVADRGSTSALTPGPSPAKPGEGGRRVGLALIVFAVVGLTGPGRVDIEDGQTRFEAGRNLVDHGDTALRDPRVIWNVFPGRDGRSFSYYRFPQELAAAGCVWLSDRFGASEARRHFAFALHGAVAAAVLSALYAAWFRRRGRGLGWAAAGVFATPCWYYATSTFDDILAAVAAVAALVAADAARRGGWRVLLAAGLLAVAFNCKQPLAAFALPAVVLADDATRPRSRRLLRAAVIATGVPVGYAAFAGYHAWKFPPEVRAEHRRILADDYPPDFFGNPMEAAIDYAVGPSSGAVWYCPPVVLMLAGLPAAGRVRWPLLAAAGAVVGFCALLTFYKGGCCWGPRYLTPVFAAGFLFAPDGVRRVGPLAARSLLAAGVAVQLLGLAVVPERLYVWRELPTGFFLANPWLNLRPELSHLLNRPGEVADALAAPPAPEFTPGPAPTFTMPVFDPPTYTGPKGVAGVRRYAVLNGLRPWWATYPHLPAADRPVPVGPTLAAFAGLLAVGLLTLRIGSG